MRCELVEEFSKIDPQVWASVGAGAQEELRFMSEDEPGSWQYLVAGEGGVPVGIVALRRVEGVFPAWLRGLDGIFARVVRIVAWHIWLPGCPLMPSGNRDLVSAVVDWSRRSKKWVIYCNWVFENETAVWRQYGAYVFPQGSLNLMHVSPSYEEYLSGLKSRHRYTLRKMQRQAAQRDVVLSIHEDYRAIAEDLATLANETQTKIGFKPCYTARFLSNRKVIWPETVVITGRVGGTLSGFLMGHVVRECSQLRLTHVGLHYQLSRPNNIYFLMFDQAIRHAFQLGVKEVVGGATQDNLKRRLGFRQLPACQVLLGTNPPVRWILMLVRPLVARLLQQFRIGGDE